MNPKPKNADDDDDGVYCSRCGPTARLRHAQQREVPLAGDGSRLFCSDSLMVPCFRGSSVDVNKL